MLSARYEVTPDDVGTFNVHICTNSGQVRQGRIIVASVQVVAFGVLGVLLASLQDSELRYFLSVGIFTFAGVVAAVMTWRNYPKTVRKSAARMEPPQVSSTLVGTFSMTVSEDDVAIEHNLFSTRMKWAAFHQLIDTPDHLFLMMSPMRGYTIPKRTLSGASAVELAHALSQHVRPPPP